MNKVIEIMPPEIEEIGENLKISIIFKLDGKEIPLWYEAPKKFVNMEQLSTAFFNALYIPAINMTGTLKVHGEVSPKLLSNIETIQDMMKNWFPVRFPDSVEVKARALIPKNSYYKPKVAAFFTAGVDSLNTFLKHKDEIDYLVYHHKFIDEKGMKISNKKETNNIKEFAKKYGKEVIEVKTNISGFVVPHAEWTAQYHGSAFASAAILLSKDIGKFYLGSSHCYSSLVKYGSHPALDYLFEVEGMRLIHDGAESTRIDKIRRISQHPEVFKYLNYGCGKEICSKPEKCIRTMIMLDLFGIRDKCDHCNKHDYTLEEVRNMYISGESNFSKAVENYRALSKRPDKVELRKALKVCMDNYKRKRAWKFTT